MSKAFNFSVPHIAADPSSWMPSYPNPADFRFNYYKLMSLGLANGSSIGSIPPQSKTVVIVGAGVAGMTAARELWRSGYQVVILEASNRICGRHYTIPVKSQTTAMEMGAMRFPFFSKPGLGNCLLDYFMTAEAKATTLPFPNPGAAAGNTGIFMNQGWGPDGEFYPEQKMIFWPASNNSPNPPNDPLLADVYNKVNTFINFFVSIVSPLYVQEDWQKTWRQIANHYDKMSFSDLVFTPTIATYENNGWLGGFGMTNAESEIFYTIGAGDGSWGAFYEVGAMWFIRCVMFGFNSNLQALVGITNKEGLPYYNQYVHDSFGVPLTPPLYEGIQTLTEWLFYASPPGLTTSLYSATIDPNNPTAQLFIDRSVTQIVKDPGAGVMVSDSLGMVWRADYVIVTPNIWASQMSIEFKGFDINKDLPIEVYTARSDQHNISSCKVFFPLLETYWNVSNIPQIIITDTPVQDAYGVQWSVNDPGVLLASYTWEDDATKLMAYSDLELSQRVLATLSQVTITTLGVDIAYYIDQTAAQVIHWSKMRTYHGCAKLYRQRNWDMNYALLTYNQEYGASSHIYFAGENYGVEGGWTEPALRLSIDAVIRIIEHSGGAFNNGFAFSDYPRFDTKFEPNQNYSGGPKD